MSLVVHPVFPRRQWQDTNQGPNLLILHLGPGLTALPLQFDLDVSNDTYHRDSMKGQVADPTNALVVHPGPPITSITNPDVNGQSFRRDSMKGQTSDIPNAAITLNLNVNPGLFPAPPDSPVFNRHFIQDTNPGPNLVINLQQLGAPPFTPLIFEDQIRRRDTLQGQAARYTNYLPQPEPTVQNELGTFVFRQKSAQEPFLFPNVIILGIAPTSLPFINGQREDFTYKRQQAQATYDFPNVVAYNLKPTSPFVQTTFPDLTYKRQQAQAPYDFPNATFYGKPPANPPAVVISQLYESLQWRGHKTQEHFDFPNVLAVTLPIPPPSGFRVTAVQPGTYQGLYREIGDVFDLAVGTDYSAYNVNYGPNAGTPQLGWMMQVPQTTPLFSAVVSQPVTLRPVTDPIPPVRYVY